MAPVERSAATGRSGSVGVVRVGIVGVVVVLAAVVLTSCGAETVAEPQPVAAEELEQLFAGNTIIGEWLGEPYRQHFAQDGSTTYAPIGARVSTGQWRVSTATDTYESWWNERDGWESYEVLELDNIYYWTGSGVELSAFTVVDGKRLGTAEG